MRQSYSAQLKGNQLTWLDQAPASAPDSRVLVVMETNDYKVSTSVNICLFKLSLINSKATGSFK